MKKILLVLLSLFSLFSLFSVQARNRHSLNVGAGINIVGRTIGQPGVSRIGPAFFLGYHYVLSEYIGLDMDAVAVTNHYGTVSDIEMWGVSARVLITPFPKCFRFLKIGGGIGWTYMKTIEHQISFGRNIYKKSSVGLDASYRLYAIDNSRFELYGSYDMIFRSYYNKFIWLYGQIGINFGVKF